MHVLPNYRNREAFDMAFRQGYKIKVIRSGEHPVPDSGEVEVTGPHHGVNGRPWSAIVTVYHGLIVGVVR